MNHTEKSFEKFMLLWFGDFISAIGSGLTSFGLGVYIFQQTGKASLMALVTLLAFLPSLLLSPIAGHMRTVKHILVKNDRKPGVFFFLNWNKFQAAFLIC